MAVIGNLVRDVGYLRFERRTFGLEALAPARVIISGVMLHQSLANFPGQVQPGKLRVLLLEFFNDPEALAVMLETAAVFHEAVQGHLPVVTKWRMAEVMRQSDGFSKIFI